VNGHEVDLSSGLLGVIASSSRVMRVILLREGVEATIRRVRIVFPPPDDLGEPRQIPVFPLGQLLVFLMLGTMYPQYSTASTRCVTVSESGRNHRLFAVVFEEERKFSISVRSFSPIPLSCASG
jgi:hypothetical protein